MSLMAIFSALSVTVRVIIVALVAVAAGFLIWWFFFHPAAEHRAAVQAKTEAKVATAQVETAKDASATGERVQVVHDRIERITRENTTRILAAPGASGAVPADVDAAWLGSICVRNVYSHDPACSGVSGPARQAGDGPDTGGGNPAG